MGGLRLCLMNSPPERPCNDKGGLYALSRETLSYPADFLDGPTDEERVRFVCDFVFFGAGLLA